MWAVIRAPEVDATASGVDRAGLDRAGQGGAGTDRAGASRARLPAVTTDAPRHHAIF